MPNKDGTGPTGAGSLTGRGLGVCKGQVKNIENRPTNRRLGGGRGTGLGRGKNR